MLRDRHSHFAAMLPRLDPDVALVRQFRATGNPALFEALFKKYQTPIFHLVCRMVNGEDAYDLTQEVFYRALRSLAAFKGDCKFSTWLYTIAKNTCLNHMRENKKRAAMEGYSLDETSEPGEASGGPEPSDPGADVARIVETRELQRAVDGVLAQLTPEQRLLMILRDFEQLSYEEISEITDLSIVNVKSKLHRARLAFKAKFQPYLALVSVDGGDVQAK
ncbi:MAG: sigma-70 family RNA polymerase sigma factor [Armatimonadetes bacterium]|nr:sigma-70 family RNA polymerase sigma factor [Armatimonadota bacterium]